MGLAPIKSRSSAPISSREYPSIVLAEAFIAMSLPDSSTSIIESGEHSV
jgi:hypothetical protein